MRILVVIHEFPPIGGGGGRAAYDICKDLVARGHEVVVLTAYMQGLSLEEMQDGIGIVRVHSLRKEPFRATFTVMLAYILSGFWTGIRIIRLYHPDIIHSHFAVPSGALAWVLSFFTSIPYVLTAHLGDIPGGVPEKTEKWFRWLMPFTYPIWNRAKRIVAVSEYTRQLALQHYPVEVLVVPNGVDIKLLAPLEIKLNQPPCLVFAGRFVHQKNPIAIIQILSQIKDLNWHCIMLGDGPLLEQVRVEIERNGMEKRFDLLGWITPEEVLDWLSRSDILFMPSLSEGLPVVGVQALAKGLALVVSDIGGFIDLVDDNKNGYLIAVHDKQKFVNILRGLLSDPQALFQFRTASLEKAMQFDIVSVSDKYTDIFQEVIQNNLMSKKPS